MDHMDRTMNREKARRAAAHPDRPGEECRAPGRAFLPLVDRSRCEGKRDCVEVCPYDVFEVRRIEDADFAELSMFGRLRSMAHGRKSAYTPRADQCRACGLCVVACPERAIRLVMAPARGPDARDVLDPLVAEDSAPRA